MRRAGEVLADVMPARGPAVTGRGVGPEPARRFDRDRAWVVARRGPEPKAWMVFAAWLWGRTQNNDVVAAVLKRCLRKRPRNLFAYYAESGIALEVEKMNAAAASEVAAGLKHKEEDRWRSSRRPSR